MKGVTFLIAILCVACCHGCNDGFEDVGGSCLAFDVSVSVNWAQATTLCAETGGVLASLSTASTLRAVVEYIKTYGLTESFWLGGSDLSFEGDWTWIADGNRVDKGTPYWALNPGLLGYSQEPSGGTEENCLLLDSSRLYYFNDADCSLRHHVVCMQK